MSEIRASRIGAEYDPERSDPVLVARNEWGVLRPVTEYVRTKGALVSGELAGYDDVLVMEPRHDR